MTNAQYTNVNDVKRVKQTHDDKHNTKHHDSWFKSAEKELKIFKLRNLNARRWAARSMIPTLAV